MPGRSYSSEKYRFGFNGKENDNEIKGTGNSVDYGFRNYDTRSIRFNSVDPLTKQFPFYSPYQFAGNKLITSIDLDGAEEFDFREIQNYQNSGKTYVRVAAGQDLLNSEYFKVNNGNGTSSFYFKYKKIQEVMSQGQYDQSSSPGTKEPNGFTMALPYNPSINVFKPNFTNPILEYGLQHNLKSVSFLLGPEDQELYKPGPFNFRKSASGRGNESFRLNVEATSGTFRLNYANMWVEDQYRITDSDGNVLFDSGFVGGEGTIEFNFNDLSSPMLNIQINSSDVNPRITGWSFDLEVTPTPSTDDE